MGWDTVLFGVLFLILRNGITANEAVGEIW